MLYFYQTPSQSWGKIASQYILTPHPPPPQPKNKKNIRLKKKKFICFIFESPIFKIIRSFFMYFCSTCSGLKEKVRKQISPKTLSLTYKMGSSYNWGCMRRPFLVSCYTLTWTVLTTTFFSVKNLTHYCIVYIYNLDLWM